MPSNKEKKNTNPKTLRAAHNNKGGSSSSTAYGHTPGAVGLHRWHPPQAHMFASTPSVTSFSAITQPLYIDTSPTRDSAQLNHGVSSVGSRSSNRASDSPLKVRKTRENLRTVFLSDANSTFGGSVSDLALNKDHDVQPLQEIHNLTHAEVIRPPPVDPRFSWESNSIHLTTVIEQSPPERTSTESNKSEPKFASSLSRKLSVRKRVVSRVKDGLLSRAKSSSKVPVNLEHGAPVPSRCASEHERFPQELTGEIFRGEAEDYVMDSKLLAPDADQNHILAESLTGVITETPRNLSSPNPGIKRVLLGSDGSFPSPSQIAGPSPSPSPEKTPRPGKRLASTLNHNIRTTQEELTMLHIDLVVTPAWNSLDLADEAIVWTMIKAEASVASCTPSTSGSRSSTSTPNFGKTKKPLDIVVIIDNSPFSSPLALQSISEFIRRLCSLLRNHRDRLAAFCTYCPHELQCSDPKSGCQLHRLQTPNSSSLSVEVAKLETCKVMESLSPADMSAMMQEVVASVVERQRESNEKATHAIVLAPLPQICASMLCEMVSWPIHQVQVGYAYTAHASPEHARANGWCFEWNVAQQHTLETLIQSAREGSCSQRLSHVRVSINSAEPCRVERLLTPPRIATLHPGQCTTLFAKVRVPLIDSRSSKDENSLRDLFKGLQETLGSARSELFKADVRYRHSALPRNTELRTEQVCELIRTNRNSQWGVARGEEDKDVFDIEIEKAKFAARNYPPDVALKILHKKFGKFWSGKDGPSVLHRLHEELDFQQRVLVEVSKSVAQSSNAAIQRHGSKSARRNTLHHADTEVPQIFNTAPSTPTPEEDDAHGATPVGDNRPDHEQKSDDLVVQDEARRIWRHMRRTSRTTSGISSASEASSRGGSLNRQQQPQRRGSQESVMERMAAADARVNEIRLKAIQNKRSVGAETLRDFGMMQYEDDDTSDELRHEACAPWL